MSIPAIAPAGSTIRGVLLMSLAMLLIPLVDGFAKHLSSTYSPLFISWARYAAASIIILPLAMAKFGTHVLPTTRLGSHFLRTVFLMASMTLYFMSIARIPLATAISAYFIGPIIATVLAVVWLGERMTWRKGLALLLGFAGAMLILRPGGEIDAGIMLAMGAGVFFALYLIVTRQTSQGSDPLKTLVFQCLVGALILTPQAIWTWSWPATSMLPFFFAMAVTSILSHILSITAFRYAEASTLAPLVYLELVASVVVGYYIFNDFPGSHVWLGAGVIVAGGLLVLQRKRPAP